MPIEEASGWLSGCERQLSLSAQRSATIAFDYKREMSQLGLMTDVRLNRSSTSVRAFAIGSCVAYLNFSKNIRRFTEAT